MTYDFDCVYGESRFPIELTNDWRKWYFTNQPNYPFEVYSIADTELVCVKKYDDIVMQGMIFGYYDNGNIIPIITYTGYYKHQPLPIKVRKTINRYNLEPIGNEKTLQDKGFIRWVDNKKHRLYVYTEFTGQYYSASL